jgi:hypothetical protein
MSTGLRRAFRLSLALAVVGPGAVPAQLPESALSVRTPGGERIWWRSGEAPARWMAADPAVAGAVRWCALRPGLESGQLDLSGDGVAWRIAVVLAVAWGWLVHGGAELQPPGNGPLSAALVVDRQGRVELLEPGAIASARAGGRVREAFQSYPAILVGDGDVPEESREVHIASRETAERRPPTSGPTTCWRIQPASWTPSALPGAA